MSQSSPKQSNYRKFQKGDRVVLQDGREATVKFEGSVLFTGGYFVGLALDQPSGKHDGRINGRRYFHCPKGHGLFVRPISIQTILNPSHNNQWRVRSNNNNNRNNRNNRSNHHNQHYYNSNNTHNCNKYRNNNKQNNNDYNANLSHSPNQLQRNTINACNTSIAANITNPNSFNPSNRIPNHSNPMNSMPPMSQIIHQTTDINKIGLTLPVHIQNTAPSNINNININKNTMPTQPHLPQPPLQQRLPHPLSLPLPPPQQQQQQQIRPPPLQQQQQQQQQQLRPPPLQQPQQPQLPNTNINLNTINANASPYQVHTALINPSALISAFPLTHQNISLYNSIPNHLYNIFTRSTPNSLYSSQLPPYPASTVSCLSYQGVLGGLRFDPNTTNLYATNPNIANANNQCKKNCNTIVINELPVLTPKHCPKAMAFPRDKLLATALSAHSDNVQKHKELELQHKTPEPQHIQHIEQMQEIEEIEEIEEEERERDRESVSFFKWANFDDAEDIKDDNDYFALKLERRRSYPFVESELHLGKLLRSRSRVNDKLRQEKRSLKTKIDEVQNVSTELWSKNAALQSKNKEYLAKLCCIKNKIKNILDYQSNKELAMLFDSYLKDVHSDNNNNMANEDADIAESAITDCSPSSTVKTRDHESVVSCTERERERDHLPLTSVGAMNTLKDKGLSHVDEDCVTAQSIIANNTVLTPYHHNKYLNRLNFNNKIINDRKTGAKLQKRRLNMWNNLKYNRINENSTINNELNESEIRAQGSAAYHNIRSVESPSSDSSVSTRKSAVFASIPELEHNI